MSKNPEITLRILQELKRNPKQLKAADSTGVELSSGDLLVRTLALRSYLRREVLGKDERHVGVFLPPTVPAVAANLALALDNRVAVNLNYTTSSSLLAECSAAAGLKHVLTSRKFIDKVGLDVGCEMVFLEDIKERITIGDKLSAFFNGRFRTVHSLHRALGLSERTKDDPLTIIFTSGSTGTPKGVVLSSRNVEANIDGIRDLIHLDENDVVLGVLPFFHSFGYTVTLWTAMTLPCMGAYHFSPLEARPIGNLADKYGATVLLATPTFLRSYIKRVEPKQFGKLDVVVVGAEKMPLQLAQEFEEKFGVRPVEGYGTTELSPVVCVNVPPSRSQYAHSQPKQGICEGSVGRPFLGTEARVVSVDNDEPMPAGETGLLEIRGPNVMQGYLNAPDETAKVMHDDWYRTGDVGIVDEDGFIHITGRLSRFSKIGGEMVPHLKIEELLQEAVAQPSSGDEEEDGPCLAVTAIPDEKRGERLIVLHKPIRKETSDLIQTLKSAGLPNLYIPSEDSFWEVDSIPLLGSGKLDLRGLKDLAHQLSSS